MSTNPPDDPFPNWKPGEQYCLYCKKIVEFPHHCPELVDKKAKPTHEWVQCLDPNHELKHKVDGRSPSNRYLTCSKCTWHVPKEYIDSEVIYPCPGDSPTPFTKSTYTGMNSAGMTCPRCKSKLKTLNLKGGGMRYYCPRCNPEDVPN